MEKKILSIFIFALFISQFNSLDLEKIRSELLDNHNYHRKRHQVENLVRSAEIEKVAQNYSEYQASINTMKHSDKDKYGENLLKIYIPVEQVMENVLQGKPLQNGGMQKLVNMIFLIRIISQELDILLN